VFEAAAAQGLPVVTPEERDEMLRQMGIRRYAPLTKGSINEIGVNLGAAQILFGSIDFVPASQPGGSKGALSIRSSLIDIRNVERGPSFQISGPIESLSSLQTELAWRILQALIPNSNLTLEEFRRENPSIRLDALESYARGLLANSPEAKHKLLANAARLEPAFSQPCFQLGKLHYERRDYRLAAEWLAKVSAQDAHYREGLFLLGLSQLSNAENSASVEAFQKVAMQVPNSEVLNNLAVAQMRAGNLAGAIANLQRALELNGADPDLHFNLGFAYWKQGSWEDGVRMFRSALGRQPDDQDSTLLLGKCLAKTPPRAGDTRTEGIERVKREFNDRAWLALKQVLAPKP
jgi:tetratricopeptide (TPR) repeat protein